ncbi:MAG: mannitol dehydrogenase family protein [Pseudorhodobacter sp.]
MTATTKPGIVHLGLGAFFRAHGAAYIARAMEKSGGDWGIIGVSLQSPRVRDALAPNGFAYWAVEQGPEGEIPRRMDVIQNVLVAPEDPAAVLEVMADPAIRIVTLTVTEKGYCHNPATGALNPDHPDILHDLTSPLPRSAPGFLVRALQMRHTRGLAPFTAMTCDNLPENGRVLRAVVLDLARRIDPGLADWIAAEGRFPATMVDRIVPATKQEDITRLHDMGIRDAAPVMHEPFGQWVIEDDFVAGERPDLVAAGAELVADVTPYEHMKLRMLNGTHSALAYLGYLAGHETIADTVADTAFAGFVKTLWTREIIPALTPPPGVDLSAYARQLFQRYSNPAIRHRTWQIAMDGSQKLPQRILGTWVENHAAGRESPGLTLAVAGWMHYISGCGLDGKPIDVRDPLAEDLARRAKDGPGALLDQRAIFSEQQARDLRGPVATAHAKLAKLGAQKAIEELT